MAIASDFARCGSGIAADEARSRSRRNRQGQSVKRVEVTDPSAGKRFAWPPYACRGSSHARAHGQGNKDARREEAGRCLRVEREGRNLFVKLHEGDQATASVARLTPVETALLSVSEMADGLRLESTLYKVASLRSDCMAPPPLQLAHPSEYCSNATNGAILAAPQHIASFSYDENRNLLLSQEEKDASLRWHRQPALGKPRTTSAGRYMQPGSQSRARN